MASLLLGALLFTACDADRDSNPVIDLSRTQDPITLNTPAFATGTYDMANTEFLELTCSAPSYGYTPCTYSVQLSLDADMSTPNELTTTFYKNKMQVPGKEIAIATTKQLMSKQGKKQDEFPIETPVYLRVRVFADGATSTETYSNIIKLNNVKTEFALPNVEVPDPFYVNGNFTANNWEKAVKTAAVNGLPSNQWRIVWIDADGITVSNTMADPDYSADLITTTYTCSTMGFSVTDNGKVVASTPGWYTMLIAGQVDNSKRTMELNFSFSEPEVYLIGPSLLSEEVGITTDNCWDEGILRADFEPYVKFTNPTEMDGQFVSPKLLNLTTSDDGGSRAYARVKTYEWWKTEFFVYDKKIMYRGNGGELKPYTVGNVGERVYMNFSTDEGELKADE